MKLSKVIKSQSSFDYQQELLEDSTQAKYKEIAEGLIPDDFMQILEAMPDDDITELFAHCISNKKFQIALERLARARVEQEIKELEQWQQAA